MVRHHYRHGQGKDTVTRTAIPDREKGALDRLKRIMEKHPDLWAYHQSDPRGCQLYIGKRTELSPLQLEQLDSYYTKGFSVCI